MNMRLRILILAVFCIASLLASATEKDKLQSRRDTTVKVTGDSITIIINDDDKDKLHLDDTLVFDDQEAPKGKENGFVLNKKTGEGYRQNDKNIDPNDNNKEFRIEPEITDMPGATVRMPMEAYPNPAVANKGTKLLLPYNADWVVTITQITGQTSPRIISTSETALILEIPLSGAYIIKAVEGNTVLYKRLIVQ